MFKYLIKNHVLATITFWLVIVLGAVAYTHMPREKNPEINFNWIQIITTWRGTSATDIEKLITDPLEEAASKTADVRFVSSESMEGASRILVRFTELDDRTFNRRLTDLRREVQNKANNELPKESDPPQVFEITSSNAFPTVTVGVYSQAYDENMRKQAAKVASELERIKGISRVMRLGLNSPELQVRFKPETLEGLGITPADISESIKNHFRDVSAGTLRLSDQQWVVRVIGSVNNAEDLARLPVITTFGEVPLGSIAKVVRGRAKPTNVARLNGEPAVLLAINKQGNINTLKLVANIKTYIKEQNERTNITGITLALIDDQTTSTRSSIATMQNNAIVGLLLVLCVTWLFLGFRMAILTTIGIPFTLMGTFWILSLAGFSLNNSVLLGVVISLGMLVDDAIVVVETIYFHLQRGMTTLRASLTALSQIATPITAAVLTTIAAFLPLMLMPGVLGQFMRVVPLVVTITLLISLMEAFWMLPSHIHAFYVPETPSRIQKLRERLILLLQIKYIQWLIPVLRHPKKAFSFVIFLFALAISAVAFGFIHVNFFSFDPYRLYYVNVEMASGTPLDETIDELVNIEKQILAQAQEGEIRGTAAYAGNMFTETEAKVGDHYGQIMVSLNPHHWGMRSVDEIIQAVRDHMKTIHSSGKIFVLKLSDGPPTLKAINIKIKGDDYDKIRAAATDLKALLSTLPALSDISDQDSQGRKELVFTIDVDAARRAGLNPSMVARIVGLYVDGEIVARVNEGGEKVNVRVLNDVKVMNDIPAFLRQTIALADGDKIPLGQILNMKTQRGQENLRHHEFRRAITVQAELDKTQQDTVTANNLIKKLWGEEYQNKHHEIELDFSGELDDIKESMDAIISLFLLGAGLIFLILGTQFHSFWQPLMVLSTVPLAFIGVVLGLLINQNPLSLFTIYGIVALSGIAVNSAIVMISLANEKRQSGMSLIHSTVYAARRRVVPIIITSSTTVAGLFSLAAGIGGHSLMWSPVATAIVWGLAFSTILTLFVIPLLYCSFMGNRVVSGDLHTVSTWQQLASLFKRSRKKVKATPTVEATDTNDKPTIESEPIDSEPEPTESEDEVISQQGIELLRDGKVVEAIRFFERAANQNTNSYLFNLYAAHALMLYMQEYGLDEGFLDRTKRYLDRAEKIDPADRRFRQLLQQYQTMINQDDEDD